MTKDYTATSIPAQIKLNEFKPTVFCKKIKSCPWKCQNPTYQRAGFIKYKEKKIQRYLCLKCHRHFTEKTKIKEKLNVICPYGCDVISIKKSGRNRSLKKKQVYLCKICRKTFTSDTSHRLSSKRLMWRCKKCGTNKNVKKNGHRVDGVQQYRCFKCDSYFVVR